MIGYESSKPWEMKGYDPELIDFSEEESFSLPVSPDFRSHMRKASRVWWQRWCEENLVWGDQIEVTSDAGMGIIVEVGTYTHCDNSHLHVRLDKWGGSPIGTPTCFVINITKKESWNDEWL